MNECSGKKYLSRLCTGGMFLLLCCLSGCTSLSQEKYQTFLQEISRCIRGIL